MTDRTENIIALAEWMGLHCEGCTYIENKYGIKEFVPDCCCDIHGFSPYGFNPYESADDCEAVVRKLNELGWTIYTQFAPSGLEHEQDGFIPQDAIEAWNKFKSQLSWKGDDWKEGVCELALKVAVAE